MPLLSLRAKLLLASVLVQSVMLGLLVVNSLRLINDSLLNLAQVRVTELSTLFNAALAAPMAQRDYGTLRDILQDMRSEQGIAYLVMQDRGGRTIASVGRADGGPLPAAGPTLNLDEIDQAHFNLALPIHLAGQEYGRLAFGLSTGFLREARAHLLRQSLLIALAAVVLSILLLMALGIWLTRHMTRLTRASEAVAAGRYDTSVAVAGTDEVARLALAFNSMTQAVRERIHLLEDSEERFHAIADYTYDLEVWLAPDGHLRWVNPAVRRMLGFTPEECLAMPNFPICLVPEAERAGARQKLQEALQGEAGSGFEFNLLRRDGSLLQLSANWNPIYDRQHAYLGLRASLRDVSALKQAEHGLRTALGGLRASEATQRRYAEEAQLDRARLVSLLSAMNLGILFVGADGTVIYHNPAFLRIWMIAEGVRLVGMPATDVLAHSSSMLSRPDHFSRHLLSVLETREVSDSFEIAMADGRVVTQLNYPVRSQDGHFIGHLWIYEDVTNERQTAAARAR